MNLFWKSKKEFTLEEVVLLLYTVCLFGTMAMMSIGAGIVFVFWLWNKRRLDIDHSLFKPLILLAGACVFSLAWAKLSDLSFMGMRPPIRFWADAKKTWHLLFPFFLLPFLQKLHLYQLKRLFHAWVLLGILLAILGILQYYLPLYRPLELPHTHYGNYNKIHSLWNALRGHYHATGFFAFHLTYATVLAFPACVVAASLFKRHQQKFRWDLAGLLLLFCIANLVSYSKIAWVALPMALIWVAWVLLPRRSKWVFIAGLIACGALWTQTEEFKLRFQGMGTIDDRLEIWAANLEMIKQFPLLGVGWHKNSDLAGAYYQAIGKSAGFQSHAHNNFIDQWATTGLLGLIPFIWLNVVIFMISYRCFQYGKKNNDVLSQALGLGFCGGWIALHINGLTQVNWWDSKILHHIGWLSAFSIEWLRRISIPASTPTDNQEVLAFDP